jgi:hypothetical protein
MKGYSMKLSNAEVEVLVMTLNPTVERYRSMTFDEVSDEATRRYEILSMLQLNLEEYYQTTKQLERE